MALGRTTFALAATALLSCASPAPTPPPSSALRVFRTAVDPKELDLGGSRSAAIRFETSRRAKIAVTILDEVGTPVRVLELGEQPAGPVTATWDGRDSRGAVVRSGVYLYGIAATDSAGASTVAEVAVPGGDEVLVQQFTVDPETGTMRFVLPQPSRVRLRVGLRGLPILQTLYDWTPLAAGPHQVDWDGFAATREIRLRDHPALDINLTAFALSGNAILVRSTAEDGPALTGARPAVPRTAFRHAQHALEVCHEPQIEVSFPDAPANGRDGLPLVSGTVPVRVTIDSSDAGHLLDVRFEVMLFLDTVLLTEVEEGSNPFTYTLDTRALSPGPHFLTVNVLTGDDHAGTQTVQFERRATGKAHGE